MVNTEPVQRWLARACAVLIVCGFRQAQALGAGRAVARCGNTAHRMPLLAFGFSRSSSPGEAETQYVPVSQNSKTCINTLHEMSKHPIKEIHHDAYDEYTPAPAVVGPLGVLLQAFQHKNTRRDVESDLNTLPEHRVDDAGNKIRVAKPAMPLK